MSVEVEIIKHARLNLKTPVVFDEEEHTYHLGGKQLRGVSSIVKQFKDEFDSDYWSKRKANERGVAQEVVLKEWADKAQKACEEGTEFHLHAQFRLEGKGRESISPKAQAFDRWFKETRPAIVPVGCEVLLWDETLGIAGTCDLLFYSTKTKMFHILDWKTNGKFNTKNDYGRCLKPPFENLWDCELASYSIQIGIYKRMAQRLIGCPLGQSWIMHVGEEVTPHRAINLGDKLETALKNL